MMHTIRKRVIVQEDGLIQIHAPELNPGTGRLCLDGGD